jgi:hypothetical protein
MINFLAAFIFLILLLGCLFVCFSINFAIKQKALAKMIELKEKEKKMKEAETDQFEKYIEESLLPIKEMIKTKKEIEERKKRRTIYDPQEPSW